MWIIVKKLGLQSYSIRDVFKTEDEIKFALSELARYGYTEIEIADFFIDPVKTAQIAKQEGIKIIGSHHYNWNKILKNPDEVIEVHKAVGAEFIAVGGQSEAFASGDTLTEFVERANDIGKRFAEHGMKFVYHNHHKEFKKLDGKCCYFHLADGFNEKYAMLEFDVYWAQFAGIDVCDLIRKLKKKIGIIHLKDMLPCYHPDDYWFSDICEVGYGNINFEGIISEAEKAGIEHFVVEQDYNWRKSPLESAKESAEYLKANFGF